MERNTTPVNIEDWVYSDSPGIWKVYRVIQGVWRLRFDLQKEKRVDRGRLVFSKRLVDKEWKPAFANEVAHADLVHPLSGADRTRLEEFIAGNPKAVQEFEAFPPEPIDLVCNFSLNMPALVGREESQRLIHDVFAGIADEGLTNTEILQRMAASELARYTTRTVQNATLQFICKDHELRNNEYVFRKVRLVMV